MSSPFSTEAASAEEGEEGSSKPRFSATRAALADADARADAKMDAKLFPEFPGVATWAPAEPRLYKGGITEADLDTSNATEEVRRLYDLQNASQAERNQHKIDDAISRFRMHEDDVGSTPVQCAVLTERIKYMTVHLQEHRKDKHGRRGLQAMLNKRRSLLKYLRNKDFGVYKTTITALQLKDTYY